MTAPDALAKIEQTCADLLQKGKPVTFTMVAAAAGISRTTLYRDPTLRMVGGIVVEGALRDCRLEVGWRHVTDGREEVLVIRRLEIPRPVHPLDRVPEPPT